MKFTKQQKRILSRIMNKGQASPKQLLEVPLSDDSRWLYDKNSEGVTEFGFVEVDDETDEEIDEWFRENVWRRIPSHMFWDCTGCLFTWSLSWHRNPNGLVSFVNRMSYDV